MHFLVMRRNFLYRWYDGFLTIRNIGCIMKRFDDKKYFFDETQHVVV